MKKSDIILLVALAVAVAALLYGFHSLGMSFKDYHRG